MPRQTLIRRQFHHPSFLRAFGGQILLNALLLCGFLFALLARDYDAAATVFLVAALALGLFLALSAWITAAVVEVDNDGIAAKTHLGRHAMIRWDDLSYEEYRIPTFGTSRKARLAPRNGGSFVWVTELLDGYDELAELLRGRATAEGKGSLQPALWERFVMRG